MRMTSLPKAFLTHLKVERLRKAGTKIDRNIVVFESDDWGSIRMPSLAVRDQLLNCGIQLQSPNTYDRVDTLATDSDLTALMEVLSSVKDKNSNPALITLDTVVANPDFSRIKESGYTQYYYEPFSETLKRYPHHENAFALWREGIDKGVFRPQFHGREHLNVQLWMKCLQSGEYSALKSFEHGFYSMKCMIGGKLQRVLETYNAIQESDYPFMRQSVKEGLDLFERLFGYRSESMIAPCYTWDEPIEKAALDAGVSYLQGNVLNSHSAFYSQIMPHQTPRIMGNRNKYGQLQLVRNCSFEPSQDVKLGKDRCLHDIEKQFKLHHPAIVSCHRLNFIGDLVIENRDRNLKDFKDLLQTIVKQWPDVEFMSSDELGKVLLENGKA